MQGKLADMYTRLQASRAYMYKVGGGYNAGAGALPCRSWAGRHELMSVGMSADDQVPTLARVDAGGDGITLHQSGVCACFDAGCWPCGRSGREETAPRWDCSAPTPLTQVAADADAGRGGTALRRDCASVILLAAESATQSALDAIQVTQMDRFHMRCTISPICPCSS